MSQPPAEGRAPDVALGAAGATIALVAGEQRFRRDLFAGTAEQYDRFRPSYPQPLLADLLARVPVGTSARVLDLACGTGQIACALAAQVGEVVAVDQEPEMIDLAAAKAAHAGVTNIRWIAARAEDVALHEHYDLVTIGNAFHRLERDVVAARVASLLRDGGCVALLWGDAPWMGPREWQRELRDVLDRWMAALDAARVPATWSDAIVEDPHERVLRRAGLDYRGRFEFSVTQHWTIESLIGFAYSTSVLNRSVVAHHAAAFEADVTQCLRDSVPNGSFECATTFAYELARRIR